MSSRHQPLQFSLNFALKMDVAQPKNESTFYQESLFTEYCISFYQIQ